MARITRPLMMIVFIGVFGVFSSHAEQSSISEIDQSFGLNQIQSTKWSSDTSVKIGFGSMRHLVNRESTLPPSESHSGRESASPQDSQIGGQRKSSQPSGLAERRSSHPISKGRVEMDKGSRENRGSLHDPFKGGGESHSNIKKRSGVR